jgi:hypothetical protein
MKSYENVIKFTRDAYRKQKKLTKAILYRKQKQIVESL